MATLTVKGENVTRPSLASTPNQTRPHTPSLSPSISTRSSIAFPPRLSLPLHSCTCTLPRALSARPDHPSIKIHDALACVQMLAMRSKAAITPHVREMLESVDTSEALEDSDAFLAMELLDSDDPAIAAGALIAMQRVARMPSNIVRLIDCGLVDEVFHAVQFSDETTTQCEALALLEQVSIYSNGACIQYILSSSLRSSRHALLLRRRFPRLHTGTKLWCTPGSLSSRPCSRQRSRPFSLPPCSLYLCIVAHAD